MDFEDDILDIEGFAFGSAPSPYPMKLFVPRIAGGVQSFVFVAPRTNELIDNNGGFMITYPSNYM